MTPLLRSEVVRLSTVPAPLISAATVAIGSLMLVAASSALVRPEDVPGIAAILAVPPSLAAMVLLVLGALAGASDFQHRTADMTFLAQPRRSRVMASRATVYAAVGVALAGMSSAACALTAAGDHRCTRARAYRADVDRATSAAQSWPEPCAASWAWCRATPCAPLFRPCSVSSPGPRSARLGWHRRPAGVPADWPPLAFWAQGRRRG
jgi:hypothetical protein